MQFIVFQHLPCEHPGIFREFMRRDGVEEVTVELDAGDPLPTLETADALLVFGGPMNVYEEERYPWLGPETAVIREAALGGLPVLGICLGAQLLAKALGAPVTRNPVSEVGLLEIELTPAGEVDPLFAGWPRRATVVQWHGDTFAIPDGAVRLAGSADCPNQAFRFGDQAYGLQFHPEVTAAMAAEWSEIPEYAAALARVRTRLGRDPFADASSHAAPLAARAEQLYRNFTQLVAGRAPEPARARR
jgi:GMP synthase-like glutamine amidotransferase